MIPRPPRSAIRVVILLLTGAGGLVSCKRTEPGEGRRDDELFRVGSVVVYEEDLERRLAEHHGGRTDEQSRQAATGHLVERARLTQAALDAGLLDDPLVRDEISRLLAGRLRETELAPLLGKQDGISGERLRELYQSQLERFQAPEKRRVAVLWLDPGSDPERMTRYVAKLDEARAFLARSRDLLEHPEKGFSVLGADYSEHHASRFRGGEVGWLQREGGPDAWTKAVAGIAFDLGETGEVSEVIARDEGIFLVRIMEIRPAVTRSFEAVASELERAERDRLRAEVEAQFKERLAAEYPVEWPDE